jgi:putative DNA primase/helicase
MSGTGARTAADMPRIVFDAYRALELREEFPGEHDTALGVIADFAGGKYIPDTTLKERAEFEERFRNLGFNLTDAGNGEFLASLNRARWRYDHARGRDLLFSGHRWMEDSTGELIQIAKEAARQRYLLAAEIKDTSQRSKIAQWAIQSESKARIEAALSLARSESLIADAGEDWDNRPMLLACANGVVDLETGILRDGKAEDRLILYTAILYDRDARCPQFEKFFIEILSHDAELIDFVHRAIGYSLTGLTTEQVLFILWGSGANGKTVLLSILRAVFGQYAFNMPFSTVELKDRMAIPNDVAALADRRLVTAAETNDGARLNEARIKALTGCDPITARFLHREFFTFRPVAKFWLAVNHKPRVADDSYGFWRRVRLIPFLCQFRDDADPKADPKLESKLLEELPGILAFCVRGCLQWQKRGLKPPKTVVTATEEYRQESDPLGQFIDACCTVGAGLSATFQELYNAYKKWAEAQGWREREILSVTAFGRRMGDGFVGGKTKQGKFYSGIKLDG